MKKYVLHFFIFVSLFVSANAVLTDMTLHGWDFVNDTGACGVNDVGSTTDDIMLTVQDGVDNMQFRVKWCIKGDLEGYTDAQLIYSETLDTLDTWTNASPPYYYNVMDQGGNLTNTSEFRFWDSPWLTHQTPISCIQTDDHNPEIGYVFENNYGALEFNNSPSSNSKCIEYELTFEYLGNKSSTYQIAMLLNGSFIPESGMHGKQGIMIQTVAANSTDNDPPAAISNLQNISVGTNYAYWNWTNPTDPDFAYVAITINGESRGITTDNFYNETDDALPNTNLTISITTFDNDGNENLTPRNSTMTTLPLPPAVSSEQIRVEMSEFVSQEVIFNPLSQSPIGDWADDFENQSFYNLTGYINISNQNNQSEVISDIYITFENSGNITLPTFVSGKNGSFVSSDVSSGSIILYIPELSAGEESFWTYSINASEIRPPLNLTTTPSASKLLAGSTVNITDTIENVFDNMSFQQTCIFDINLTQNTSFVNDSGTIYDFIFDNTSTSGSDAANVIYFNSNKTQQWDVLGGACLNKSSETDISYLIETPSKVPISNSYMISNTTLEYSLNETISHLNIASINAIGEADVNFVKQLMNPSHPTLYGSNVTWKVIGEFSTETDLIYNLTQLTLWVSKRNVNGSFPDPNTVDNDSISGDALEVKYYPNTIVNLTGGWTSPEWLFNYSHTPAPLVWMDVNYTLADDGIQLISKSVINNETDIYIKELYLIVGYWLEIEKNISSISDNSYRIRVDVHNKGNQPTPLDSVVTIYDFIPSNFNLNGSIVYSSSPWYNTSEANNTILGSEYNGTLYQWALISENILNTSLDKNDGKNQNNTWSAEYNVTGVGDYTLLDVFVTGLDPQKVDGAGSTRTVIVSERIGAKENHEKLFAIMSGIFLVLSFFL